MAEDIWFGIHEATYGQTFEQVKQTCLEAEKQGLQLFTIIDHFMNEFHPNQGPHPLECWTTLAGLAAVTGKIKLAPLVSCYGYRKPTLLAKMASTVDHISSGRAILGLGAGWHEAEFKGYFGRYPPNSERLTGLKETVEICKSMLSSEVTSYDGKLYKIHGALNSPLPVQKHLPIMIGGGGEKVTLRIAAEHADITHTIAHPTAEMDSKAVLASKLSALRRHCESLGRDYDEIRKGTWVIVMMDDTVSGAEGKLRDAAHWMGVSVDYMKVAMKSYGAICGTPEMVLERVRECVDLGVGLITFVNLPPPSEGAIESLVRDVVKAM